MYQREQCIHIEWKTEKFLKYGSHVPTGNSVHTLSEKPKKIENMVLMEQRERCIHILLHRNYVTMILSGKLKVIENMVFM